MAKRGYESQKTGQKVDELLDKIDNLNVPEWALQESKPSYTAQEVHALPENTSIPRKTSDLVNDRGFITQESDPTVPGWAKQPSKPTYTAEEVGALPDTTPIPVVPENVSAFNNDAGYLTQHQDISGKEDKSNKVTSLSVQNTDTQYPSAKAVFDNLSTKQDTINDLGSIRSGASAGATAYQKPQSGIPESDLSQGVKDKMNEKEVFWATYGTTTAAEIDAAVAAGKLVLCVYNNRTYVGISTTNAQYIGFFATGSGATHALSLYRPNNKWSATTDSYEKTNNRRTSWQATPDNTHYPSEKLVKDSLDAKADLSSMAKWGVVSQTQTWSGAGGDPRTYVMSNLQYGWIPQAFIDDVTLLNCVVFNEQTGYFELNGLTDISYQDMIKIRQNWPISLISMTSPGSGMCIYSRTLVPISNTSTVSFGFAFYNRQYLEVINFKKDNSTSGQTSNNINNMCRNDYRLKEVSGIVVSATTDANVARAFEKCYSLEVVKINGIKVGLSFAESSLLTAASVAYMINHETSTSPITITLHPTAYARAIADSDVQAALQAHTNVSLASAT